MAGAYSSYGTLQSRPTTPDTTQPPFGTNPTDTHQLVGYGLPTSSLRSGGDTTTINTLGNLTPQQRIDSLASNYYTQMQAQQQAKNLMTQNYYQTGLANLSNLRTTPDAARNIFQSAYNEGLVSTPAQSSWSNGMNNWQTPNPNSPEGRAAAYNRGVYGAANQANLAYQGIDPNAVSQAYQQFLSNNT